MKVNAHSLIGHDDVSRELLVFSRGEVTEELIQGFEYTKASGRVNFIVSVDFASNSGQATRYLGKLHRFLRIPHPRNDPNDPNMAHLNEPLRIAMVTFFQHQVDTLGSLRRDGPGISGNPCTHMIRAKTNVYNGQYYAVDPLKIINKHIIAEHREDEIFAMTYISLGSQ